MDIQKQVKENLRNHSKSTEYFYSESFRKTNRITNKIKSNKHLNSVSTKNLMEENVISKTLKNIKLTTFISNPLPKYSKINKNYEADKIGKKSNIEKHPNSSIESNTEKNYSNGMKEDSVALNIYNSINNNKINSFNNVQYAKEEIFEVQTSAKQNQFSSITENVCRICYEEETNEKGELISPCFCTGTCQYIHQSCLKIWIENNFSSNKTKAKCEICKKEFEMAFFMRYRFSKDKLCKFCKALTCFTLAVGLSITLILIVLYVVISSLTSMTLEEKSLFINILFGVGLLLNIIIIALSFRDCRKNFYEPYMYDWKIFNTMKDTNFKIVEISKNDEIKGQKSNHLKNYTNVDQPNFQLNELENSSNKDMNFRFCSQ